MVAAALVPGNETDFAAAKRMLEDGLSANFIVHAQKHCDTAAAYVLRMFEQLQKIRKQCVLKVQCSAESSFILHTESSFFTP